MNESNTVSTRDATQNTPSTADFEMEFRRTIRHGTKIQVNKVPHSMICAMPHLFTIC